MLTMSKIYRVHEFAKRIRRSPQTLRRWDREGTFLAKRHLSGHRYYDESDVRKIFGGQTAASKTVVYCRVSSASQKDDLAGQVRAMEEFCLQSGTVVNDWVTEIGGGMNFKRKRFLSLISEIQRGEVKKLLIAHRE